MPYRTGMSSSLRLFAVRNSMMTSVLRDSLGLGDGTGALKS